MEDKECLFCRLSTCENNKIYEDENLFVLLDRFPISNKHFLIITKPHFEYIHNCPDNLLAGMIKTVKDLALKFNMKKYNLVQNNINQQIIKHCHIHLIEANETGHLNLDGLKKISYNDEEYSEIVKHWKDYLKNNS